MCGVSWFLTILAYKCVIIEPWKGDQPDPAETERQKGMKRKPFQKRPKEKLRSRTPSVLSGRTHTEVQTGTAYLWTTFNHLDLYQRSDSLGANRNLSIAELHLDVLTNAAADMDCQTHYSLDKMTSPLFKFAQTGNDFGSQLEESQVSDPNKTSGYKGCFQDQFWILFLALSDMQ